MTTTATTMAARSAPRARLEITLAVAGRVLLQLRRDHRTVAMLLVVPCLLMTLLWWMFEDTGSLIFDQIGPARLEPGEIELTMPYAQPFTQQHSFVHAGIITTALDSACGYAAFSLMPAETGVLTVEFKINLLAPAKGELFTFRGRVVKPGRTITVCEAEAFAHESGAQKRVATMTATLMVIQGR